LSKKFRAKTQANRGHEKRYIVTDNLFFFHDALLLFSRLFQLFVEDKDYIKTPKKSTQTTEK